MGFRFAGGGGRWRADMASGGEGFGTERARLAGDGLRTERATVAQDGYRRQGFGTERARLAQGGFLGQFYNRKISLNEISENLKILLKNVRGGQFSKRNPFKRIF